MKINIPKLSIGINLIKVIMWLKNKRKKAQEVIVKETKTELYAVAAVNLIAIGMTLLGGLNPELAIKAMTILTGIYTVGRSVVKMTPTKIDDKVIEELKKIIEK